jgi:hypothetical protein
MFMAENSEVKLSPDARELLSLFTLQVQVQIQTLGKDMTAQVDGLKDHMERRLEVMRNEVNASMQEMKSDQREMRSVVEGQGRDITEIRTRLNEGDRNFMELKARRSRRRRGWKKCSPARRHTSTPTQATA